ncbi:carbohydrate kinase family protein [Pseudoruegeria sp. HB172150]|uniref:carbohydrate kinase family protein n=1 Tax=Pseudoruegeria sp. HB172150 TaxID=2721164 RepID=UPI001553D87F|nr:PfkB family carbohydrate kinase [Pseudoruegeria sp. HB172150]
MVTAKTGVLSVGRTYCDLIFSGLPRMPSMGTEVFAGGLGVHAGGGAPITAAVLAALGRPSFLSAVLPQEPFGALVRNQIQATGVELSLCETAEPDAEPQVTVAISGGSDRAFLTRRVGAAQPPLNIAELNRIGVRHLHVGELTTLVDTPELLTLAREAGLTVSLDCAWDESVSPEAAIPMIGAVDVFLPSDAEVAWLERIGLLRPYAPVTVIKCGERGAEAHYEGKVLHASAQAVTPVDTTGAGDAFNAGFLDRWLDGVPLGECLAAGNAMGAEAIQRPGGLPANSVSEKSEQRSVLTT